MKDCRDTMLDFKGATYAFLGLAKDKSPDELDSLGDLSQRNILIHNMILSQVAILIR